MAQTAWWENLDEARVLIAPNSGTVGNDPGRLLSLKHPKSGNTACYLLSNGVLQEFNWFKQAYASWFLGDYVFEDGRLYTANPVDPVFILLPIFENARMKKEDDQGKFRQLDEIIFIDGYPGYRHLLSIAEKSMQVICDIKEVGSLKFYRLNDSKVLAWLHYKVCRVKQTLPTLDKNYAAQDEKDTLLDAVSILGEYLKDEPWLKLLCDHLKLNITEATAKVSTIEVLPDSNGNDLGPSNGVKGKRGDKAVAKSGKQAKKAKVETESRNIKDMFSMALRKR